MFLFNSLVIETTPLTVHCVRVQVSYRVPLSHAYQKPMIASVGFLVLFLLSMMYVRSDLAIHHARTLRLAVPAKSKVQ